MKIHSTVTILLMMIVAAISCNNHRNIYTVELDSISKKWAPDKREAILNFEIINASNNVITIKGETNLIDAKKDILRYFGNKELQINDSIRLLPDKTVGNKPWALIDISVAQLRSEPDNSSELVSQAIMGTPVKVLKRQNYWVLIQTPDNYIAWVKELSLSFKTVDEIKAWKKSERLIYVDNYGIVTDEKGRMLSDIVSGCILQKIEQQKNKFKVLMPQGVIGFVDSKSLNDFNDWRNDTTYTVDDLIANAKTLMGIPYLWGGTSIKAMDCSGFIKTIFFNKGIIISRDASQQVLYGDSVSIADNYTHLRKGDLLFFESPKSGNITHVAMFIGNNEYIQAAGRVKINSLDSTKANFSAFRIPTFKYARRYKGKSLKKGICYVKNHSWY